MSEQWEPTKLLLTITGLDPGFAIEFTESDARRMAALDLRSAFDGPARESDVEALIEKLRTHHGLYVTRKLDGRYMAYRERLAGKPGE